jgi:hypothetical protein
MRPSGSNVSLLLPPSGDSVRVVDGLLMQRTSNVLAISFDDDVTVAVQPGEAVVVIVHDIPEEVLLATGLPSDEGNTHLRLQLVERRT